MARETKAQRKALEEKENQELQAQLAQDYPQTLMSVLERATKLNYELTVRNQSFELFDRDGPYSFALTLQYSQENQETLEQLDWNLRIKLADKEERQRLYEVKKVALAKLTTEEHKELGL
jgi:hypothetical protein